MKKYIIIFILSISSGLLMSQTTLFSEDFEGGIPGPQGWSVIDNEGNGVVWDINTNITGGASPDAPYLNYAAPPASGMAATASSDAFGAAEYDTELISPVIPVPMGASNINLDYVVHYQNLSNLDFLDIDVSINGGTSWSNVVSYNEDVPVGGLFAPGGVAESYSLDPFVSAGDNMMLRAHWYNPNTGDFDWYAQIDDVVVTADVSAPPPIPTMGEWGIIILGLIFLNVGIVAIVRRRKALAVS